MSTLEPPTANQTPTLTVIVIGSTGATGRGLIEQLLDNSQIGTVYSFSRRIGTFEHAQQQSKLVEIKLDSDDFLNSIQSQWPDQPIHAAISTLGTTAKQAGSAEAFIRVDYEINNAFFTTAQSRGVAHAQLISCIGADASSSNVYLKTKGRLDDRLKELGFTGSLVLYQPGVLDGTSRPTQPSRCGEATAVCMLKYMCCCFLPNCFSSWRPIDVWDIGTLMVHNVIRRVPSSKSLTEETTIVYEGSQAIINAVSVAKKREEQSLN